MNIVDSMTLYSKYLKIQASKIDLETAGEKAEEICERLQELSHYCKATDRKSTRLNSSHKRLSRIPSSA